MATDATGQVEDVDDPIAYFLDDQRYHGKSERTLEAYERVLRQFETFLGQEFSSVEAVPDADRRACMAWIHSLRGEFEPSTIATYASYLNRFYDYMNRIGAFEENPMALVMEELSESIDTNPTRRELSIDEMRSFVASISHPLERAVVVTLLKTGMRVGELCNLDLRDLNAEFESVALEWTPRVELDRRPSSVYVSDDPSRGAVTNGEERTASNKRKRETVIPVDDELRTELESWLAIRPDSVSPAEPLFLDTRDSWGERLTPSDVRYVVEKHAREHGWYRTGGGTTENVTPHYFRHFFTTHLRDRTGDRGTVQYLRGDVAGDVIDTYTHNWGDRVRETYLDHIYTVASVPNSV
ncbi:XerC/D-like integrase [Natrialba magadii ATCC 43099]|uniref:Integrase family protein n=1 Tax=Natrialba magadii (strain ATCC 43099 / DSM 3394 / CCM 3739 / CIP 104546 / IAM 13178 / JCM 8861 / NBRC 102185 / NCIMB 2190 / MS3) TaxID=547559 RepID=D3SU53_NATMM|nr:tyrosine-type recombinase/integrase [Natrialba magadii]ADD07142.1 XerC/D-like integrase [Natrialba magadii ATCC 43099]ELY29082.1 integrase family protein [Natrialba magadii ATCC 43099]